MRIALIGPPFIEIPPKTYGGTELFLADLASELSKREEDVIVYGNGDSHLPCEVRWRYQHADWPVADHLRSGLKNIDHTAWAIKDAVNTGVDVLHLNDVVGTPFTMFVETPAVLTIHHPHEPALSEIYGRYRDVNYVVIAKWLAARERMPRTFVVYHGIPVEDYTFSDQKSDYVAFLGRMVPCKGPHLAIEAARKAGVPLRLAGEIQPHAQDYWEQTVQPQIDNREIQYIGEADRLVKNELLAGARALLFPIEWEEPFGLVLIEAMACGTPVLAFKGGAVEEIVQNGVNGWICRDVDEMAERIKTLDIPPRRCRSFVETNFSVERMADRYLDVYERVSGVRRNPRQPMELKA